MLFVAIMAAVKMRYFLGFPESLLIFIYNRKINFQFFFFSVILFFLIFTFQSQLCIYAGIRVFLQNYIYYINRNNIFRKHYFNF